jgi:hypothetical protein
MVTTRGGVAKEGLAAALFGRCAVSLKLCKKKKNSYIIFQAGYREIRQIPITPTLYKDIEFRSSTLFTDLLNDFIFRFFLFTYC